MVLCQSDLSHNWREKEEGWGCQIERQNLYTQASQQIRKQSKHTSKPASARKLQFDLFDFSFHLIFKRTLNQPITMNERQPLASQFETENAINNLSLVESKRICIDCKGGNITVRTNVARANENGNKRGRKRERGESTGRFHRKDEGREAAEGNLLNLYSFGQNHMWRKQPKALIQLRRLHCRPQVHCPQVH